MPPDLTPRQRFLAGLRRTRMDRAPVGSATSIATTDLMDDTGVSFPDAHLDPRKMARLALAGHTLLGFDNVMPLFSTWHEASALGSPVNWGTRSIMPDCREHIWKTADDIRIPPDLLSRPGCRVPLDAIAFLRRKLTDRVCVMGKVFGPWTLGYHLFGTEDFLVGTLLDPDHTRRVIDRLKEVAVLFGNAQVDAGADCLCYADHATRDLCSPQAYRDFLMDVHREMIDRIRCPLVLHICGDTSDRLPYIARVGFPCFHYDSKTGDETARRLAGDKLALMGGSNNPKLIRQGSREDIFADVKHKMDLGIDIIGPECAVPLDAPWRNLRAFTDAAEEISRQRHSA
ncbi:MAG: uroporphyrinogen decarboxylase family protein [Planctomycetota bacterium]